MNQDKKHGENQGMNKPQQGSQQPAQGQQGKPTMDDRGNPSTTERIQPDTGRTGGQRPEGDKPAGNREQTGQSKL